MCPANEFLNTSQIWPAKTTAKVKAAVMKAAAGEGGAAEAVVVLGDGVTRTMPGPKDMKRAVQLQEPTCFSMPFGCVLHFAYSRCTCEILCIKLIMGF